MQPRKWPIPELTTPGTSAPLPSELTAAFPPEYMAPDGCSTLELPRAYSWAKGFNYPSGWDTLVRHVAGKLEPLGYTPYTGGDLKEISALKIPGVRDGTLGRGWRSADHQYVVALVNVAFLKQHGGLGAPGDGTCDYAIIIDDEEYYKVSGETSPNT
jgi:hypothetical protein